MMAKPKKVPQGPINFNRLTDGQQTQIQRIAQTGARIGIAQQRTHRAILDAMRDEIDALLEASDPAFVQSLFEGFAQSAKVSNLKRIAKHPLCPQEVVTAVNLHIEAMRDPANDDMSPKLSSAKVAGPDSKS
jgi:hypothetical protein